MRYYLDRPPIEFDYDSIDVVATNLCAAMPENRWQTLDVECIHLGGNRGREEIWREGEIVIYARREYEMG